MIIQSTTQNTYAIGSDSEKSNVADKNNNTEELISTYKSTLLAQMDERINKQKEEIEENHVASKILNQYDIDNRKTTFENKNDVDEKSSLYGLNTREIMDNHIQKYMEKGESEKDASNRVSMYGFLGLIDVPNATNASSLLYKKGTTEEFKESLKKSLVIEFDNMSSKDATKIGYDMVIKDSPGLDWEKMNHDFIYNGVHPRDSMNIEYEIKLGDGGKDAFSSTLDVINYIKKEILELTSNEATEETISLIDSYSSMLLSFTDKKNKEENEITLNQHTRNNKQNILDIAS